MPYCEYDQTLIGLLGFPFDLQPVSRKACPEERVARCGAFCPKGQFPFAGVALLVIASLPLVLLEPDCQGRPPFRSGRLVGAGYGAKADRQSVPSVNGDNCQGQINQFCFAETAASSLVNLIRYMLLVDQRDRLRPGERCSFALGEERCLLPTLAAYSRCSVSPAARASLVCMSTQYAQPLICDALNFTNSISERSNPQ